MTQEIERREDEGPRMRDLAGLDKPATDERTVTKYEKYRPDGTLRERGVTDKRTRRYAR